MPVYQKEPMLADNGKQMVDVLTGENGTVAELPVNQFVIDETGDRIPQKVGTGRPVGPGLYLRVEDVLSGDDDNGVEFAGGVQFDF